jgi:hypothetical protein
LIIAIDELYMLLDGTMFIDDNPLIEEHDTNSDDEEELCRNCDTKSEYTENFEHEQSSSSNNDTNYDDDMC